MGEREREKGRERDSMAITLLVDAIHGFRLRVA